MPKIASHSKNNVGQGFLQEPMVLSKPGVSLTEKRLYHPCGCVATRKEVK